MADINDHITDWLNQKTKTRKQGRYWVTDVYSIKTGRLTPDNYYDDSPLDAEGIGNVARGIAAEMFVCEGLKARKVKFKAQKSFEIPIAEGIVMSGKPDLIFPNKIFEIKAPKRKLWKIPDWYLDQLECYHRAFKLPVYLCEVQFYPFMTQPYAFTPDDRRWEETRNCLIAFDKELKKIKK